MGMTSGQSSPQFVPKPAVRAHGAPIKTTYARQMRNRPTEGERLLWERLRKRGLEVQFLRQHPLFGYIVDFYCAARRLAVEVDGSSHDDRAAYDARRDAHLAVYAIKVLRVPDAMVKNDIEGAVRLISDALNPSGDRLQAIDAQHRADTTARMKYLRQRG